MRWHGYSAIRPYATICAPRVWSAPGRSAGKILPGTLWKSSSRLHGTEVGVEMKTVILAGGFGTRLAEETEVKPKPMVEIGGKPILWHIMSIYARYGYKEFIV